MNRLKMAEVHAIQALADRGWSYRRIARELGVHRETVSRYAGEGGEAAKPAKAPPGSEAGRSCCEPHRQLILAKLEEGLSAQRIWQDLRTPRTVWGGLRSVNLLTPRRQPMSYEMPSAEDIDRLQHAVELADTLARTLDQIEIPSEKDICTIEEAAAAASELFATLKAAEECAVG